MGWYEELQKVLGTAAGQVTNSGGVAPPGGVNSKVIHFTKNFQQTAKARRLTENDATDVYFHGSMVKQNMMVRKYNGYEIGIYTFNSPETGQPVVTSIWKRARR